MSIDQLKTATFYDLFKLARFAPIGSPEFQRGTAECEAFERRWKEVAPAPGSPEWVATSKAIGW